MINKDLIHNRIDLINRSIARLKKMAALTREQFLADPDNG